MSNNKIKGDILEQVVAWLQEARGVTVQRDVRLPMVGSRRSRRQFDVLLTTNISGHEVRMAAECKNEGKRVGSPKIDKFRGKLLAVGIPPSLGIYVAPHGYTRGALEAARAAGIRTLVVQGLTADRLALEVSRALHSLVVLLPEVAEINVVHDLAEPIDDAINDGGETFLFYDEHGEPAGTVADFIWKAWSTGALAPQIGTSYVTIEVPKGWHNVIAGEPRVIQAFGVTVNIVAMLMTLEAEATHAALLSAEDGRLVRGGVRGSFGHRAGQYGLQVFRTEAELNDYLTSRELVHLVQYTKSPRIQFWKMMFWPPSQRVADIIAERLEALARGDIPDPRPFSFEQLEGMDLSAAWEPIAEEYLTTWREREEMSDGD